MKRRISRVPVNGRKVDVVARHRGFVRSAGQPDRAAAVNALVDEELLRVEIDRARAREKDLKRALDAARKRGRA